MTVDDPDGCPRYIARAFTNVHIGPSPIWLRARLHAAGMRSISNVVDVTNYVMHVYGSPLHVFDRDTLDGGRIVVRRARAGEELRTLDGIRRTLDERDLVITDGAKAVALAAIMGGEDSEVTDATANVLLEAANFEPIGILKTSERLALRTDGSNRWEKGVDPHQAEPAAVLASRLLVDLAGGEPTGSVDVHSGLPERPVVRLRPERTDRIVGLEVPPAEQRGILERLGFGVLGRLGRDRTDLAGARRHARDRRHRGGGPCRARPRPAHDAAAASIEGHLTKEQRLRRVIEDVLVGCGFTEAYTWSLVASDPDPAALHLPDPMSGDHAILRTTLLDGLVEAARVNVDAGNPGIALFELARVYLPSGEQLPEERWHVGGIVEGGFAEARGAVEALYAALHLDLRVTRTMRPFLHPGKAARPPQGGSASCTRRSSTVPGVCSSSMSPHSWSRSPTGSCSTT